MDSKLWRDEETKRKDTGASNTYISPECHVEGKEQWEMHFESKQEPNCPEPDTTKEKGKKKKKREREEFGLFTKPTEQFY